MTYDDVIENRKNWEAALRSGSYRQTTNVLERIDGSCCCLGVGCEIMGYPKTVISAEIDRSPSMGEDRELAEVYKFFDDEFSAPNQLVRDLGLYGDTGETDASSDRATLVSMNDHGSEFMEIADALATGEYYMSREDWERKYFYVDEAFPVSCGDGVIISLSKSE
jgi:hypothetical protein